eukprot:4052784-Prymnesium_polylepis.1
MWHFMLWRVPLSRADVVASHADRRNEITKVAWPAAGRACRPPHRAAQHRADSASASIKPNFTAHQPGPAGASERQRTGPGDHSEVLLPVQMYRSDER